MAVGDPGAPQPATCGPGETDDGSERKSPAAVRTENRPVSTGEEFPAPDDLTGVSPAVRVAAQIAVAGCLLAMLAHVLMVFLHVAPMNTVSKKYSSQVHAWVYPLFEQNWQLFAPNPKSVNEEISVRTIRTSQDGTTHVGDWFNLTADDLSAIRHSPFPSHTEQNMLRRAWSAYRESHGSDEQSHSEHAVMMRDYLRNIAAQGAAAHRDDSFGSIQLRVTTRPIPSPGSPRRAASTGETKYLPWWTVKSDGK